MDQPRRHWYAAPVWTVAALSLSALLLVAVTAVYLAWPAAGKVPPANGVEIPGGALITLAGQAQVRGDDLALTGYQHSGEEYHNVSVARGRWRAEDLPLVAYRYHTAHPGPLLNLVWRTAASPQQVQSVGLNRNAGGRGVHYMAHHPEWRGTLVEIGLHAVSRTPQYDMTLEALSLRPHDWRGVLASHWSNWTAFRGWTLGSINFIHATADPQGPSPVPVAAAWAGLAALLLGLGGLVAAAPPRSALVAVLVVPWLGLDLLWQHQLGTQVEQTRREFAGKSLHQRHLVDTGGSQYRYAQRLRQVLPAEPAVILIVQDSAGYNFERLKLQFYLLPHNVYNFGALPKGRAVNKADYLLVLGDIGQLSYRADPGRLVWGRTSVPVARVQVAPQGTLYRVTGPTTKRKAADRD